MTIHFFLQSKDFGGAEQFAQDLLETLAKQKQQIILYTSNPYLLRHFANKKLIKLYKTPFYLDFAGNYKGLLKSCLLAPFAILSYCKLFYDISRQKERQIILYSGFSEKIVPGSIPQFFNLPVYFIEYGPLAPLFKKLWHIPHLLYFLHQKNAKKVIVPSFNTKTALKNIFSEEKLTLIPCGTKAQNINQNTKIQKNLISVVSRLEKGKGQDLLIKAFLLAKKTIPDLKLQIIGQGNFETELKKMAKHDQQIEFCQFISNKQALLEKSALIVCPSVWALEGFGLTIIEAMALGKAIVAFDRAPGNELLTDNYNALLAKNEDYVDLSRKIIQLLKNQTLQKKLALHARQTFNKKYEISVIAQKYLKLLQA